MGGDGNALRARPRGAGDAGETSAGKLNIGTAARRDAVLYVPPGMRAVDPVPLLVMFHGAGGRAEQLLDLLVPHADSRRFLVLAPESRSVTWDGVRGELGPDFDALDRSLEAVFSKRAVSSIAIGGFSDGASYALTVGRANGELFDCVVAWSPGFDRAPLKRGNVRVYVSHGKHDDVLPIERCSRRIVPALVRAGHDVRYDEFAGGHTIPPSIVRAAVGWMLRPHSS